MHACERLRRGPLATLPPLRGSSHDTRLDTGRACRLRAVSCGLQTRLSKMVAADTERTFACTVPAWGEGGKMPEEATFTTNLQGVLRLMVLACWCLRWSPRRPVAVFGSSTRAREHGLACYSPAAA